MLRAFMESDRFSSHPPCKRRAGWNGLQGLQMLVIEHTTESGEAASEVMNSSPQIQTWKQPGWNYSTRSLNERANVRRSQGAADSQGTSPGMSTMRGTLLVTCQGGVGVTFFNGEIVLRAKWYHIANSPGNQLKLLKWQCFFLVFKCFNS